MKKSNLALLFLIVGVLLFNTSTLLAEELQITPKTIIIPHAMNSSHPIQKALELFKSEVELASNNLISIEIFSDAVLGDDSSLLDQIRTGALEAAVVTGGPSWFQGSDPRGAIEELPFLFATADEARSAYEGAFGEYLKNEIMSPFGIEVVTFLESGFRHFTSNIRPIVEPADMAGQKFRIAPSILRQKTFEALNASAISMSFSELYTALQQGTVDAQENPLTMIVTGKLYEVQKYVSLSGHIWNTAFLGFNQKTWDSLSEDEQKIISESAIKARAYLYELDDEQWANAVEYLKEKGALVNSVNHDAFVEAVQPVWDYFIEQNGDELIKLALGEE